MFKIKNKKGFTLVELIVVMAVLAIISAIAVPRFLGVQAKAEEDADYATGAMIAKAAELYEAKGEDIPIDKTITAQNLISKNYINSIEFKSDKFIGCTAPENISIVYGAGTITITAEVAEGEIEPLYPRPPVTP